MIVVIAIIIARIKDCEAAPREGGLRAGGQGAAGRRDGDAGAILLLYCHSYILLPISIYYYHIYYISIIVYIIKFIYYYIISLLL